ncbi:MAG: PIN domain-containing protein [Prosthecobacter sp.]|jgi:toxin-antitoxin system PIN domain toxin|uniref:TA system VapC family ribonuclease toxin n=1 Tax=Prosthecobacter sp. TaxID=1965333 RepID=UPI001A0AE54B|nr:TA system VapC family ribonuclease toxin [Prosthecobacter sp.]MBE2285423.1 PIN domain-containing protein [Prosthecobacter sp.]
MLSIDTNILFHAFNADSPSHAVALAWITSIQNVDDVAISEFILAELYGLLRNPAILKQPLSGKDAVEVIQTYRQHPRWRLIGYPTESRSLHDMLWQRAADKTFAFRRLYDARSAMSMTAQGVTDFATANVKDFQGLGFRKVWNPLNP